MGRERGAARRPANSCDSCMIHTVLHVPISVCDREFVRLLDGYMCRSAVALLGVLAKGRALSCCFFPLRCGHEGGQQLCWAGAAAIVCNLQGAAMPSMLLSWTSRPRGGLTGPRGSYQTGRLKADLFSIHARARS